MINMRFDDRGMATAELIFATFIALVVIGAMLSMISDEVNQSQVGNLGEARISGENIAEALNTVYINGNGYSAIIRLIQILLSMRLLRVMETLAISRYLIVDRM